VSVAFAFLSPKGVGLWAPLTRMLFVASNADDGSDLLADWRADALLGSLAEDGGWGNERGYPERGLAASGTGLRRGVAEAVLDGGHRVAERASPVLLAWRSVVDHRQRADGTMFLQATAQLLRDGRGLDAWRCALTAFFLIRGSADRSTPPTWWRSLPQLAYSPSDRPFGRAP